MIRMNNLCNVMVIFTSKQIHCRVSSVNHMGRRRGTLTRKFTNISINCANITMSGLLVIGAFLTTLAISEGHICLVTPHQRGKLDISTSGNPSCFRHGAPCGGQAAEDPKVTLTAGSYAFVKWQQNYNHYSVGYPGYMDLAIVPVSSSDFKLLAVTSDKYVHAQDYHKNYTVVVMVPDMECDHCVLRVRYNAHKPGESTFYQCADVKVTKSSFKPLLHQFPTKDPEHRSLVRVISLVLEQKQHPVRTGSPMMYGLMYNPNDPDTVDYVAVDTMTGVQKTVKTLNYGVGFSKSSLRSFNPNFIVDAVLGLDLPRNVSILLNHDTKADLDQPATTMLTIGTNNGSIVRMDSVHSFDGHPFSALVFQSYGIYLTFSIEESKPNSGKYIFVVGMLYFDGTWIETTRTTKPEDTYINYMWAEYDPRRNLFFVLLGNENDPDVLTARIYTFDIGAGSFMKAADLDVSKFTFMSMQLYVKTGQLFAVSPGLFNTTYPAYSLVVVDPFQGSVSEVAKITQPGLFERYYGGTVFNGIDQGAGTLTHVFRVADADADVIATIGLGNGNGTVSQNDVTTTFSPVTNIRHGHNLVLVVPP